jgi:hypothetical protein
MHPSLLVWTPSIPELVIIFVVLGVLLAGAAGTVLIVVLATKRRPTQPGTARLPERAPGGLDAWLQSQLPLDLPADEIIEMMRSAAAVTLAADTRTADELVRIAAAAGESGSTVILRGWRGITAEDLGRIAAAATPRGKVVFA